MNIFLLLFFQAPRSRQVAASAVARALQQQRTRVQASAASRCRLLLVLCLFCFFRGVCVFLDASFFLTSSFLFLGNTKSRDWIWQATGILKSSSLTEGRQEFYQLALHRVRTQDLSQDLEVPKWTIPVTHHWCGNLKFSIFGFLIKSNCQLASA